MTNRDYIKIRGRIPPKIAELLQPFFPARIRWRRFDVGAVPVKVCRVYYYGHEWNAVAPYGRIELNTAHWARATTEQMIGTLAHELWHVAEYRRQGLISWALELWRNQRESRAAGSLYDHRIMEEENEANAKRRGVLSALSPTFDHWRDLLDAPV